MATPSPIIPWLGGKRRLADIIIPRFPAHTCYVEVFAGGAALYFLRTPAKVEVINDVNGDVVNLYRVVQNHLEEFVRQFKWSLSSREIFKWLQDTPPETLTDIQRAARFFYLQQHCFGGKVEGQTWGDRYYGSTGESASHRGDAVSRASALGCGSDRALGLGQVRRALRQAAHVLLYGPALPGDRGLRSAFPARTIRADGSNDAGAAGQSNRQH